MSETLICYLIRGSHGWEKYSRCTILQWRDVSAVNELERRTDGDHTPVSMFTIQRCREDNSLYGGVMYVVPEELHTEGERWAVNYDVPFDDDIPF